MKDSLGDRMKGYESVYDTTLPLKSSLIVRLDGKAFHTYTRGLKWPSLTLKDVFNEVLYTLVSDIQGCILGYHQSDEISLLITDDIKDNTSPYFGNRLQKICSITASMATYYFNKFANETFSLPRKLALFDSRVFIAPNDDVPNYFVWRFQDNQRNVIQSIGQSLLSHKQLQGMSNKQLMALPEVSNAYNALRNDIKFGTFCVNGLDGLLADNVKYDNIANAINYIKEHKRNEH